MKTVIGFMNKFYTTEEKKAMIKSFEKEYPKEDHSFFDITLHKFSNRIFKDIIELDKEIINLIYKCIYDKH